MQTKSSQNNHGGCGFMHSSSVHCPIAAPVSKTYRLNMIQVKEKWTWKKSKKTNRGLFTWRVWAKQKLKQLKLMKWRLGNDCESTIPVALPWCNRFVFYLPRFPVFAVSPCRGVGKPDKRHHPDAGEKQRQTCCISSRPVLCDMKNKMGTSKKHIFFGNIERMRRGNQVIAFQHPAAVVVFWKQYSPEMNLPGAWHALCSAIMCV